MIVIEEETPDWFENTKVYERCHFCNVETKMWHHATNTPICVNCASCLNEEDINRPLMKTN